jgi:MoxR-like ATPase
MTTDTLSHEQIEQLSERIRIAKLPFDELTQQVSRVIVGQEHLVHRMLVALLSNGHLLIEGVPGLAKTLTVSSMAKSIDADFQRIQFTPDLLPADLTGTQIYRPADQTFTVQKGPVFSNFILADEINRAPAKVQSALLEAMQEHQVTIGTETFKLPEPFLVMATQNPIEQEGTYPLPEAQVDRFLMKVVVGYPTRAEERAILDRMGTTKPNLDVDRSMTTEALLHAREMADQIYVDDKVRDYIVNLVAATRDPGRYDPELTGLVEFGASPRATIALTVASRAQAFLAGRGYVVPQDVKDLAMDILRHRVVVTYEAEAEDKTSEDVITTLLNHIPVP